MNTTKKSKLIFKSLKPDKADKSDKSNNFNHINNISNFSKYFTIFALIISLFTCMISLTSCSDKKSSVSDTGFYFDTAVTITLYNATETTLKECFKICDKYEKLFSNTIESSDISKINSNSKSGKYTTVSNETVELIKAGIHYGDISSGKFDITIGYLSELWNFSGDSPKVPDNTSIENIITHIDYNNISINGNEVLLTDSEAKLDLGGIAKGYIADKLKEYLKKQNISKGIINLGGNILLIGSKPDNSNYNIGLQKPFGSDDDVIAIVNANDLSIVTSGIYERYFYENNKLYHHILNTSTGYPEENNLLAVTIISKSSTDGDGLSTSAYLLGLEDGMNLIESIDGVEAVFIDKDYKLHLSSGLKLKDNVLTLKSKE